MARLRRQQITPQRLRNLRIRDSLDTKTQPNLTPEQRKQIEEEFLKKSQEEQLKELGKEYDNYLQQGDFFSVQQIEQEYNKLPSDLKPFVSFTPEKIRARQVERINSLNQRLQQLNRDIEESRLKEREAKTDRQKEREDLVQDRLTTERDTIQRGINDLRQNRNLSVEEITGKAKIEGRQKVQKEIRENIERSQNKRLLETGEITSINTQKNFAIVNGKRINLSKREAKNLKLSAVTRANANKELLAKQREEGKRRQDIINKAVEEQRELTINEYKDLGLTPKQVAFIGNTRNLTNKEIIDKFGLSLNEIGRLETFRQYNKSLKKENIKENLEKLPTKTREQLKELISVKELAPDLRKQLQTQTTTTDDLKKYTSKLDTPPITDYSLFTPESRRLFAGERLVDLGGGLTTIITKEGKARPLTPKEKEALTGDVTYLNPARIIIGIAEGGGIIGLAVKNPKATAKALLEAAKNPLETLSSLSAQAQKDPFGFIGQSLAFEGAGKISSGLIKKSRVGRKTLDTIKGIRIFEDDTLEKINSAIDELEKKGVKINQRTPEALQLRLLKEEKKIFEKYRNLTTPIDNINTQINKAVKKLEKSKSKTESKSIVKELSSIYKKLKTLINKRDKLRQSKEVSTHEKNLRQFKTKAKALEEKRKKIRERQAKKSKAEQLAEFEKARLIKDKKSKLKIKILLPKDKDTLAKLALEARKKGGNAFSQFKKRLKKEQGLNIVVSDKAGEITFKFLEPKEQRRKGIKSKRKQVQEFEVVNGTIKKKKPEIKILEKEIIENIESVKDEEFKESVNLAQLEKDFRRIGKEQERTRNSLFKDKKASLDFNRTYRKFYRNKIDKRETTLESKGNRLKKQYKSLGDQVKTLEEKPSKNKPSKKELQATDRDIKKLNKKKNDLDNQSKNLIKDSKLLRGLLRKEISLLRFIGKKFPALASISENLSKQAQSNLQATQQLIDASNININSFKNISNSTGNKGTGTGSKGKPSKPITPKKTKKPSKPTPPKSVKAPKGKPTPKTLPKKFGLPTFEKGKKPKLKRGERYTYYIIVSRKGKKETPTKSKYPKNQAILKGKDLINNDPKYALSRSFSLLISGVTKRKDKKLPELKKIGLRRKRSNDPRVLDFVETSRAAISSATEKAKLQALRSKRKTSSKISKPSNKKKSSKKSSKKISTKSNKKKTSKAKKINKKNIKRKTPRKNKKK